MSQEHLLYYLKRRLEQMLSFVNDEIRRGEYGNNVDKGMDGVGRRDDRQWP